LKQRGDAERWRQDQATHLAESRALLAEADAAQYETGDGREEHP
jgi:hypothetical protein